MAIDAAGLRFAGWKAGDIVSSASFTGSDSQITLRMDTPQETLTRERWDCRTGDSGRYFVSLSPDEQTLTLTLVVDDCAARGDMLAGDWTRWTCPKPAQYASCVHVSELTPGRYVSPVFRPFWSGVDPGPIGPASGQLAYTVPAGWAKLAQPPTWPELGTVSSVWFTRLDAPDRQAIRVFSNTYATYPLAVLKGSTAPQCDFGIGSDGTATQVADLLESLAYLSVASRAPLTIGGLTGVQIDVSLVPGFADPCLGTNSIGQTIISTKIQLFQDEGGQGGAIYLDYETDAYARFILLDTANGREEIVVTAPDAASLAARVAVAMPVIESFEFLP